MHWFLAPSSQWFPLIVTASLLVAGVIGLWLGVGTGPRRRRAYQRGRLLLEQNAWREALAEVGRLQSIGRLPKRWGKRATQLAGDCHRQAGAVCLGDKQYEECLDHLLHAARLLNLQEEEARDHIIDAMLAEVRRLFAADTGSDVAAVQNLITRILMIRSSCLEATFWLGLCYFRAGKLEEATRSLETAREPGTFLDPPFYLGMVLTRQGRTIEALRYLSEAHRLSAASPFVNWQLGQAILTAGRDPGMAVRALQQALDPRGLPRWLSAPDRAWVAGLGGPDRAFVPRLANDHLYTCPVLGGDIKVMIRQVQLALAQGYYRLEWYEEAAELCRVLIRETAPTLPVLRCLGLSLARLHRYDEAFKHLRAAYDWEEPKTATTAGNLALCGAKGKPTRSEDRASNIAWSIQLLKQFDESSSEWAGIYNAVFAEALAVGLDLGGEDWRRCADVMAAGNATDVHAAGVYDRLWQSSKELLQPGHARLYCLAALEHGYRGVHDLDLFGAAFQDVKELEHFASAQGFDFEELECVYLVRWAEANPASFPPAFGAEAADRARRMLLALSQRQEEAGCGDEALASALALLRLLPADRHAFDRLACLHFRQGDEEQSAQVLTDWHQALPEDHLPLIRRAVLEQKRGQRLARTLALRQALQLTRGSAHADIAWLGARLCLFDLADIQPVAVDPHHELMFFLDECLKGKPDHAEALACQAGLCWLSRDMKGLADLAATMPQDGPPAYHYLSALCHWAANDDDRVLQAADRSCRNHDLAAEGKLLQALVHLRRQDPKTAFPFLKETAESTGSYSSPYAMAWLGRIGFVRRNYTAAVSWWQKLPPDLRTQWNFDTPYHTAVFLVGVTALQQGKYEVAAQKIREAGRLGYRDRRLGLLLQLALFKAGRKLLASSNSSGNHDLVHEHAPEKASVLLEKCYQAGCHDRQVSYLLALAYLRQGKDKEARDALRKITTPDAGVQLQMGLLSLREGQVAQAADEFQQAWDLDGKSFPAGFNLLLSRLSTGQIAEARAILANLKPLAPTADNHDLLHVLQTLLTEDGALAGRGITLPRDQEQHLLDLICGLGNLAASRYLLEALCELCPGSQPVQEARFESILVGAKLCMDRGEWSEAEQQLTDLVKRRTVVRTPMAVVYNLLGCCTALGQDFHAGAAHFAKALKLNGNDPRIYQNRALTLEWQNQWADAEQNWDQFILHIANCLNFPFEIPSYIERLSSQALQRLATSYSDRQDWAKALEFLERAHRLERGNADVLERLFHLYHQLGRTDKARKALHRLRQLNPDNSLLELYELELMELRQAEDLDGWIAELRRIVQSQPHHAKLQERAALLIGHVVHFIKDLYHQSHAQLQRALRQVRSLQHHEINWRAVRDVMRGLWIDLNKLNAAVAELQMLGHHPEHGRMLRELTDQIRDSLEHCRQWLGSNR